MKQITLIASIIILLICSGSSCKSTKNTTQGPFPSNLSLEAEVITQRGTTDLRSSQLPKPAQVVDYGYNQAMVNVVQVGEIKTEPYNKAPLYLITLTQQREQYKSYWFRHDNDVYHIPGSSNGSFGKHDEANRVYHFPDTDKKLSTSRLFMGAKKVIIHRSALLDKVDAEAEISQNQQQQNQQNDQGAKNEMSMEFVQHIPPANAQVVLQSNMRHAHTTKSGEKLFVANDKFIGKAIGGLPGDGGALYTFGKDGGVMVFKLPAEASGNGLTVHLNEYVPYTDKDCSGKPLNYAHVLTNAEVRKGADLKEIGMTAGGNKVYAFQFDKHPVLKAAHERYLANIREMVSKDPLADASMPVSLDIFARQKGVVVVKDKLGRYVRYLHEAYLCPTYCDK